MFLFRIHISIHMAFPVRSPLFYLIFSCIHFFLFVNLESFKSFICGPLGLSLNPENATARNKRQTKMLKTVAVIGAGPGGLANARAISSNTDFEIDIYERNRDIGGVWYYTESEALDDTPMYDQLETNICKDLMQFNQFPLDDDIPQFPSRLQIWKYLRKYYETFIAKQDRIQLKLSHEVTDLKKVVDKWEVTANGKIERYDFVVVANGHFDHVYIPQHIPGLTEWQTNDLSSIFHSKSYKNCSFAAGKTVVVVGNGSSGTDIANQLSTVANKVFHSVTDVSKTDWSGKNPIVTAVSVIKEFDITNDRCIWFQDGVSIKNVDYVILATGYLYDIPFLTSYRQELLGEDNGERGSTRLFNLWEQISFRKDPTIAFPLLCKNVVHFPLSETQACLIAKVFTGKVHVPQNTEEDIGTQGKDYHSLPTPKDIEYIRDLQEIIDAHGGTTDMFQPIRWGKSMERLRQASGELKRERTKDLICVALKLRSQQKSYKIVE